MAVSRRCYAVRALHCGLRRLSLSLLLLELIVQLCTGHPFCRECLGRWQATSHICPVCRTDQRTLERHARQGQSSQAADTDEPELVERPSLATILELMGQLLAREGAGPAVPHMHPPASHSGSGVHFSWSSQPSDSARSQPDAHHAAIDELQSSVQFVMVRIESLERRPLYWNAQVSELQAALQQLDACRQGTAHNSAQAVQQVQLYTDTVNAQLDEFLTQSEAREQQQRAAQHRQQAQQSQPSGPSFASAPPARGTDLHSSNAPTSASSSGSTGPGSDSWQWKWGWGPAPSGAATEDPPQGSTSSHAQQSSGIGFGAAAAAAAALASVGTAAAAAYRRATANSRADASAGSASTDDAQHQPHAESFSYAQQQPSAGPSGSDSQASGPPVQGVYNAVRGIFDQHVSPDSSLGRWGEVARHLTDMHGQMNAADPQRQDVGRLLASAVNAYSAYRRATASSGNA